MATIFVDSRQFFANEPNLIDVYEFDKPKAIKFYSDLGCMSAWCCCICGAGLQLCTFYCCDWANIRDDIDSQHVASTVDGVKYVKEKHPSSCRLAQCDIGKVSKTVPFDKLTDCDIEEPAGAEWCGLVPRTLTVVNIDTASGRELSLWGLQDPHKFKAAVWDMKRKTATGSNFAPPSGQAMERGSEQGAFPSGGGGAEMVNLLREQNELLRKQVQLLQEIANKK